MSGNLLSGWKEGFQRKHSFGLTVARKCTTAEKAGSLITINHVRNTKQNRDDL